MYDAFAVLNYCSTLKVALAHHNHFCLLATMCLLLHNHQKFVLLKASMEFVYLIITDNFQ